MGNYEDFKGAIYDLTKINLDSYKERQMKRRIESLIRKSGFNSYTQYVEEVKNNKSVLENFLDYITINVSEFYRNPDQWYILENQIIPELFTKFGENINIWSAACSTGDEPYSLAMLLDKMLPNNRIKILATDLDNNVLEKAKLGLYNEKSLKSLPEEFKDKHFEKIGDKTYRISDYIKSRVDFRQHDLLRDPYPKNMELVVCRNVLIYFTDTAKHEIYSKFHESLKKDGILFVGSTEQIIQYQQIGFQNLKSFFYKNL